MQKTTLVLGASTKLNRYSNTAVQRLVQHGIAVYAIGAREGMIYGVAIRTGFPVLPAIHTVTLYLNPKRQEAYVTYIIELKPMRVIFNPGTENESVMAQFRAVGIEVEIACTLVLLATNQY